MNRLEHFYKIDQILNVAPNDALFCQFYPLFSVNGHDLTQFEFKRSPA
jgi:hypothetical protein